MLTIPFRGGSHVNTLRTEIYITVCTNRFNMTKWQSQRVITDWCSDLNPRPQTPLPPPQKKTLQKTKTIKSKQYTPQKNLRKTNKHPPPGKNTDDLESFYICSSLRCNSTGDVFHPIPISGVVLKTKRISSTDSFNTCRYFSFRFVFLDCIHV